MPITYCETPPPPGPLADAVECVWTSRVGPAGGGPHRVLPDGCADLIYARSAAGASLVWVGTMTRFADFPQQPGSCTVGLRFRPGMWTGVARAAGPVVVDRVVPLVDLWGRRAAELVRRLEDAADAGAIATALLTAVDPPAGRSPVQHAIGLIERSHGGCPIDAAAAASGLGPRQFRRRCLEATGLSPKRLARVCRFRRADAMAAARPGGCADVALACGYADQSHMIADFQELAGRTPRQAARAATGREGARPA